MMKTVLCKYTLFAKVMTRLSQDPLASSISGTRRSIDTALEEIMAEFSMVFQLELHRQILQKKNLILVQMMIISLLLFLKQKIIRITY